MAGVTHTTVSSYHGTLTAGSVDTITLTSASGSVEVINRGGSAEIYFTVGTPAELPAVPVVGADGTFVVPQMVGSYVVASGQGVSVVALVSSGSPSYSIVGGQS